MAKKKVEKVEEVSEEVVENEEVVAKTEKPWYKYYREKVIEDANHVEKICAIAAEHIDKVFGTKLEDPRIVGVIFSVTYTEMQRVLNAECSKTGDFKKIEINIGDRLIVSVNSSDDDEYEKSGNIMFGIRHLNVKKKDLDFDPELKAIEKFVQFHNDNITKNTDTIRKISIATKKALAGLKIYFKVEEMIMPIFIYVYDALVQYLSAKRIELGKTSEFPDGCYELTINFINCFEITARENKDKMSDIYIKPSIMSKLGSKNDDTASKVDDED